MVRVALICLALVGCAEPKPSTPVADVVRVQPSPTPTVAADIERGEPGQLDTGFGERGIVLHRLGSDYQHIFSLVRHAGTGVTACGQVRVGADDWRALVLRFREDGTPDERFGGGGSLYVGGPTTSVEACAAAHDGKIIAVGMATDEGGHDRMFVARVDVNGSLDTQFGQAGIVVWGAAGYTTHPNAILTHDDAMFIAGTRSRDDGTTFVYEHFVQRVHPDGTLEEPVFASAGDGSVPTRTVALSDGRFVTGGFFGRGAANNLFVSRLLADGKRDASFGAEGVVHLNAGAIETSWALAADGGGNIFISGETNPGSVGVLRVRASGELDPTWGKDGVARGEWPGNDHPVALISTATGLVAVGTRRPSAETKIFIARWDAAGRLDTTFAGDGFITAQPTASSDAGAALIDERQRLWVAGSAGDSLLLLRFWL